MRARLLPLTAVSLLVATLAACGSAKGEGEGRGTDRSSSGSSTTPAGPFDGVPLTEDLACGFGFAKADRGGEALLLLRHTAESTRGGRTVTLPDRDWDAEVRVGSDLAANWCSDVIVEPQAQVDETWQVVEGTLRFEGEVPPFEWTTQHVDQPVRAELTGIVVEGPAGERAELGDLALSNQAWGLLPG